MNNPRYHPSTRCHPSVGWGPVRFPPLDYGLLLALVAIMALGFIMVTSASIGISEKEFGQAFYYSKRHAVYLVLGLLAGTFSYKMPPRLWQELAMPILISTVCAWAWTHHQWQLSLAFVRAYFFSSIRMGQIFGHFIC